MICPLLPSGERPCDTTIYITRRRHHTASGTLADIAEYAPRGIAVGDLTRAAMGYDCSARRTTADSFPHCAFRRLGFSIARPALKPHIVRDRVDLLGL